MAERVFAGRRGSGETPAAAGDVETRRGLFPPL